MSQGKLSNAERAAMQRLLAERAAMRYAVVTNYDPKTHMAMVKVMPEEIVSGWLPIAVQWVGNSFGLYVGPNVGDQVIVVHVEGDPDVGIIVGRLNSASEVPPAVPAGEAWAVHKSGSFLKFTNDGNVLLNTQKDLDVTVGGDVNMTVTGKVVASATEFDLTGDLKVTGAITATKEGTFNGGHTVSAHTHGGVQTGGGSTSGPTG